MEILRFKAISDSADYILHTPGHSAHFSAAFTDITVIAWIAAVVSIVQAVFQKNSVRESVSVIGGRGVPCNLPGACGNVPLCDVRAGGRSLRLAFYFIRFVRVRLHRCAYVRFGGAVYPRRARVQRRVNCPAYMRQSIKKI